MILETSLSPLPVDPPRCPVIVRTPTCGWGIIALDIDLSRHTGLPGRLQSEEPVGGNGHREPFLRNQSYRTVHTELIIENQTFRIGHTEPIIRNLSYETNHTEPIIKNCSYGTGHTTPIIENPSYGTGHLLWNGPRSLPTSTKVRK